MLLELARTLQSIVFPQKSFLFTEKHVQMSICVYDPTFFLFLDELYGIKGTTATFPGHKFVSADDASPEVKARERRAIILNSGDELFADLRDCNFTAVSN